MKNEKKNKKSINTNKVNTKCIVIAFKNRKEVKTISHMLFAILKA